MSAEPLDIDRALALILARATPLLSERVRTEEADARYLTESVQAAIDLPPFTNSAMDGYAVRAADTPGTLQVVGESAAGRPCATPVHSGQAITISTGAVLPDGADSVVPIERIHRAPVSAGGLETIDVPVVVSRGDAVRERGSDVAAGVQVIPSGTRLGPAQLAAAISTGAATVECGRRPRVAVMTTGDELRRPGEALAAGQIYDSNGPMLAALLARAGAEVISVSVAADTANAHREALERALEHDVVISTGGVSVGPHDLVRGIGAELGVEEVFWRIRMRPGKPLSFGTRGATLVFGLPGNPVSTLVCFELFVAPALAALQGATQPAPRFTRGRLGVAVKQNSERDDMIRVRRDPAGTLEPVRGQQSHQISITATADGLARIPAGNGELPAGSDVAFLSLTL